MIEIEPPLLRLVCGRLLVLDGGGLLFRISVVHHFLDCAAMFIEILMQNDT